MGELVQTPWAGSSEPKEDAIRAVMEAEGLLSIYRWSNAPGDQYAPHSHDYHKVIYCLAGSIRFMLPEEDNRTIELTPGDRLDLPPGVRHAAAVGPQGVTCLEGHLSAVRSHR